MHFNRICAPWAYETSLLTKASCFLQASLIHVISCCIRMFVHLGLQIQCNSALADKKPLMLFAAASAEEIKVYNLIKDLLK